MPDPLNQPSMQPGDPRQSADPRLNQGGDQVPTNLKQHPTRVPVRQRQVKKKKNQAKRIFGAAFYAIWICLFLFVGTVWGWIGRSETAREFILNVNVQPEVAFKKNQLNLLLLGCDEDLAPGGKKVLRQAGRADMILLARLDFEKKTIVGISIPRDTRVQLPGEPNHKLNAYHALAKPEKANERQQEAVEYLTGVKVDRTIVIDYVAFQELVDTVGGVQVNIKDTMKYTDKVGGLFVDFKPGPKLLDGYDAMCYVRFRKDKGGDFRRTERQREFLVAFKQSIVKNYTQLPTIIERGIGVLGRALTTKEIASLANFSRGVPPTNITMSRLPTLPGRGSFEELDRKKARALLNKYGYFNKVKTSE